MSARHARVKVATNEMDEPRAEDLGRVFLRSEGIKRFVVSSPGDISVECQLNDQMPLSKPKTNE